MHGPADGPAEPGRLLGDAPRAGARRPEVVVVTSDSRGSGKLSGFAEALPDRIVEVGIAEQTLVGVAAGLASAGREALRGLAGLLPDRARRSSRSRTTWPTPPSRCASSASAPASATAPSARPTTRRTTSPSCARSPASRSSSPPTTTRPARPRSRPTPRPGPVYVRIGKRPVPDLPGGAPFELGRARLVRDGGDLAFLATGETVWIAYAAAERLAAEGPRVPRPQHAHAAAARRGGGASQRPRTGAIVTVEEHSISGGLGEACAAVLAEAGLARAAAERWACPTRRPCPGHRPRSSSTTGSARRAWPPRPARSLARPGPAERRRDEPRRRRRPEHVGHEGRPLRRGRPRPRQGHAVPSADLPPAGLGRARRRRDLPQRRRVPRRARARGARGRARRRLPEPHEPARDVRRLRPRDAGSRCTTPSSGSAGAATPCAASSPPPATRDRVKAVDRPRRSTATSPPPS